jgi:hypothetical protein
MRRIVGLNVGQAAGTKDKSAEDYFAPEAHRSQVAICFNYSTRYGEVFKTAGSARSSDVRLNLDRGFRGTDITIYEAARLGLA